LPQHPITLFIIQAGIIIIFCRLLNYPLSLIRQPRVIAEVIGGILLGPSVMGRIPGFTTTIFPTESMPNLNLVANLGLVLFLFLVGLEVDLRFFVSNWKIALSVGTAGMALPFGLGCAIAWGLYNQFHDDPGTTPISFGIYMLFIGVAMAITVRPTIGSCLRWLLISFPGFPSSLSYSDRVETLTDACRRDRTFSGCQQRCRWMDSACVMCCSRQCWKRAHRTLGMVKAV
jgi:hypothetical protein